MILDEIVQHTKLKLAATKARRFASMFNGQKCLLICELKIKSPSHPDPYLDNVDALLNEYMHAGVDAVSVVTENKFFGGNLDMVPQASRTGLPVLRKDFIVEARQIAQVSTDALLLIARIVSSDRLKELVGICSKLDIEPVVEIHDESDLPKALDSGANTIAVNARDLQTQTINQSQALNLLAQIPENKTKLLFSGIKSPKDIENARKIGANGVLVGTSVLEAPNRIEYIKQLKEACL